MVALDDLAFLHVLFEREFIQLKDVGKLEFAVHFLVAKGLIVEDNPLQVDDQHVGHISKQLALTNIDLLAAAVTKVVLDQLTLELLLQTGIEVLLVFYLD